MSDGTPFSQFLYDEKTGKVLGRSGKSWLRIGIFYVIYYIFLGCLMYFSLGMYQKGLENNYNGPKIMTRVDQPGMSAMPFNNILEDNLNKNFEFNPADSKSYQSYVDEIDNFINQYDANVQNQFNKKMVREFYSDGKILTFLRVNKVIDWMPVGFASSEQMVKEGGFKNKKDGAPSLDFSKNNDFQTNGVYFFCNSSSNLLNFEFIPLNNRASDRQAFAGIANNNQNPYAFISQVEYNKLRKDLREFIEQPKSMKKLNDVQAPFVAVAVSANYQDFKENEALKKKRTDLIAKGEGDLMTEDEVSRIRDYSAFEDVINVKHQFECFSVARNIEVQRELGIGVLELGFTYSV